MSIHTPFVPMPSKPIHRWVLILLLLVYPFQVALAMADKCCVTTAAGVSHHLSVQDGTAAAVPEPVFLDDDDGPSMADPHCPACMFGHILTLPSDAIVIPAQHHGTAAVATLPAFPSSPPAARPERPKWPAAAE